MSDIEKEFFEAFGIEPKKHYYCAKHLPKYKCVCWDNARVKNSYCNNWNDETKECEFYKEDIEKRFYPPITSDIVLGLVCIINNFTDTIVTLSGYDIEQIKKEVLNTCIKCKDIEFVKEEVQELFRKEESDG